MSPVSGRARPAGAVGPARLDRCRRSPFESSTQSRIRGPDRSRAGSRMPGRRSPSTTVAGSSPPAPTTWRSSAARRTTGPSATACASSSRTSGTGGLVVLGSGSIPLATASDRQAFVAVAAGEARRALANNRYSADVVADRAGRDPARDPGPAGRQRAAALARGGRRLPGRRPAPALAARDRHRWPLDLVLVGAGGAATAADLSLLGSRIDALRAVAADPRAELLVGGRTSSGTLAWLERHTAARTRAWVEERGLRAASRLAQGEATAARRPDRPPGSILGLLLDRDGPGSLGDHLARFADAAIVDTPRPARPPGRRRRGRLAGSRGPVRLGPSARRAHRRSVAPRADGVGRGGPDPGPARWPHARRPGRAAGRRRDAAGARHGGDAGHPARSRPGPRRGRAGRRPRGTHPRRDRARRADHVRPVHGPRPVRPRRRLLPGRGGAPRSRRRLPDRPGGAPDLRCRARPGRGGRLGPARPAGPVRPARIRRRERARWRSPILDGLAAERPDLAARLRYDPIEVEPRRLEAIAARLAEAGHGGVLVAAETSADAPIDGVVLANEVLDALPVHRVVVRDGALREVLVGSRDGAFVDVEAEPTTPALAARLAEESHPARRGPARRDLPRARRLGGRGVGRPRARRPAAHRLRLPRGRALRPGPAPRWHAPRLPPPSRPRRPVHPRRPPGPDRPRRRHRGRDAPRAPPVSTTSARRPRPSSSSASARRTCCARSRPTRRRRSRTTSRSARRSCACSIRRDGAVPGDGLRARLAGGSGLAGLGYRLRR